MSRRPYYDDCEVALICTERLQYNAVQRLFDKIYLHIVEITGTLIKIGRIGKHGVVVAFLDYAGRLDTVPNAGRVPKASIWSKFTNLKLVILTGRCGGVPFINNGQDEVMLGDVIIDDWPVHYKFTENKGVIKSKQK
ncbi:hypothetical protein V8C40DRAFT_189418 [Trichoderma camerunense]